MVHDEREGDDGREERRDRARPADVERLLGDLAAAVPFFDVSNSALTMWCTTKGKATMVARSVATVRGRPTSKVFSVISRRPFHSSTWAFFFTFVRPPMRRRGAARGAARRAPRRAAADNMRCGSGSSDGAAMAQRGPAAQVFRRAGHDVLNRCPLLRAQVPSGSALALLAQLKRF